MTAPGVYHIHPEPEPATSKFNRQQQFHLSPINKLPTTKVPSPAPSLDDSSWSAAWMTGSRWRCLATALPPPSPSLVRAFSLSTSCRNSSSNDNTHVPWPGLKRKGSSLNSDAAQASVFSVGQLKRRDAAASILSPSDNAVAVATDDGLAESLLPQLSSSDNSRVMLILSGLSTSLKASDFQRLVPSDLSSWGVIKHVQQKRDTKTLEPLGTYYITFTSAAALSVYQDKLLRLHNLNKLKLNSSSGDAWHLSVPAHLRSGANDLDEEADSFTLTPGSLEINPPVRKRAGVPKNWWARQLGDRVKHFGYGPAPPAVLLHIYPPTVTAQTLAKLINQDGQKRGCSWDICEPLALDVEKDSDPESAPEPAAGSSQQTETDNAQQDEQQLNQEHAQDIEQDPDLIGEDLVDLSETRKPRQHINYDTKEKLRSRFVIVCANEAEAHRFHRYWNQRKVMPTPWRKGEQNIVHASRINW